MRILDFMNEAFDVKALSDEYLKQAAAVDPNAQYKPRMLVSPETARAELDRRAGVAPATQPGTLRASDGSAVVSGDGTPVRAGTEVVPPAPAPAAAEPAPAAVATPVATPGEVNATPIPPQADSKADNSGAGPAATTDFDSMSFGTAFKTARNQGLKQFNWKGKPYTTQTANEVPKKTAPAPSSSQKVMPKLPPELDTGIFKQPAPVVTDPSKPGFDFKKASAAVMGSDQKAAPTTGPQGQPLVKGPDGSMGYYMNPVVKKGWQAVIPAPVKEEVGFTNESLDRIVSLVHYR